MAAVLALVIEQPGHAYELWTRFEQRYGRLIPVGCSRIYKAVKELSTAGLIAAEPSVGPRRRGSTYSATSAGEHSYCGWLSRELYADPARAELLDALVAAADATIVEGMLDNYEARCLEEMSAFKPDSSSNGSIAGLLARERRMVLASRLEWVAYARATLRETVQ
jgi:DNA-binding PadR family transcriptional regulator